MAYSDLSSVTALCVNVKGGISPDVYTVHAARADRFINGRLGENFYFPVDENGNTVTPPDEIVSIANELTAGYIEQSKYAASSPEPGTWPSYANSLIKSAKDGLADILAGRIEIPGLQMLNPVRAGNHARTFRPMTTRGRRFRYGGEY